MKRAPHDSRGFLDLARVSVLILDDHKNTSALIGEILRGLGVRGVYRAETCAEAMQRLRSTSIDVLLVDIALGAEDGLEFVRIVRAHGDPEIAELPIVVVSSYATEARVIESGAAGADRFLSKPLSVGALASRFSDVLAIPRPRPRPRRRSADTFELAI